MAIDYNLWYGMARSRSRSRSRSQSFRILSFTVYHVTLVEKSWTVALIIVTLTLFLLSSCYEQTVFVITWNCEAMLPSIPISSLPFKVIWHSLLHRFLLSGIVFKDLILRYTVRPVTYLGCCIISTLLCFL